MSDAHERVRDLMARLERAVAEAKAARDRQASDPGPSVDELNELDREFEPVPDHPEPRDLELAER